MQKWSLSPRPGARSDVTKSNKNSPLPSPYRPPQSQIQLNWANKQKLAVDISKVAFTLGQNTPRKMVGFLMKIHFLFIK